jgi:4-hydroxy-2-oxoglutarate aldolase
MKLQGIFISVATPFNHRGEIWPIKVEHNVVKWNRTSVAGYLVCSAVVGERSSLSNEEKIRMWESVAKHASPEKLRIAHSGAPSVDETLALTDRAASLGYQAAVIDPVGMPLVPQLAYFREVADRAKIPIIMHALNDEFVRVASEHPNVIAIIGGAMIGTAKAVVRADLQLLNGSDYIASGFERGASAVFSPIANAAPYAAISIWEAYRTRDKEAAEDWQRRIEPANHVIWVEKYGQNAIAALKYAMDLNGYYGGPPRLPLTVLTPHQKQDVERAFAGIKG